MAILIGMETEEVLKNVNFTLAPITRYTQQRLVIAWKPGGYGVPREDSGSYNEFALKEYWTGVPNAEDPENS